MPISEAFEEPTIHDHASAGRGPGADPASPLTRRVADPPQDVRGRSPVLLLTILEAARMLGIGRSKAYELIAAGELEVVRIGRTVRVPVDALEEFVRELRAG